jgi:hypothetical protein
VPIGRALTREAQVRYAHVEAVDTARVRIVVVPVLTPGIVAITIGRFVLVRRGWEQSVALIGHELVHVEQWRRLGAMRFLVEYLGAHLRSRRAGLGHRDAYRAIPFEQEARLRSGA